MFHGAIQKIKVARFYGHGFLSSSLKHESHCVNVMSTFVTWSWHSNM